MVEPSDDVFLKSLALNRWLLAVFGPDTQLAHVLAQAGIAKEDIVKLETRQLPQMLDGILAAVEHMNEGYDGPRRNDVMRRRFGLTGAEKETLQSIGTDLGLSRERIRQLVDKRLDYFQEDKQKQRIIAEIGRVARGVLGQ